MDELNFLDLAILKKVDSEASVERFGSIINTSFFETANLLGTVKIKGYVNIESSVGGISKVTLTEAGSALLSVAEQRAKEPIEPLDNAILHALAGGAKELDALQSSLNIRSGDLAFHIGKLVAQGLMDYSVKSAKVSFVLTEAGFNSVGGVRVQQKLGVEPAKSPLLQEEKKPAERENVPATPAKKEGKWRIEDEDVASILGTDEAVVAQASEAAKPAHGHAHKKEHRHEHHRKPETPEERKASEKRRRLASKAHYYFTEYLPYIILIVAVAAIFVAAIFLSLSKLS